MISYSKRTFLAALALGLAVTGPSARADSDASRPDAAALQDTYDCVANICVGMTVRVIGGEWAGHAGQVIAVDAYQDEVTFVNSSGYTIVTRTYDLAADLSQPSATGCVANICLGDQVRVLVGAFAGYVGTVVDADDYNYTATVLVAGRYIIEDVRDLSLNLRPTVYRPYGNFPRNCGLNYYVYDIYRGCVRITYAYPRPYVHVRRRSVPTRVYYPAPQHMPKPPRYYPNPRGSMPGQRGQGPQQGGRGPQQGTQQGGRGQHQGPQQGGRGQQQGPQQGGRGQQQGPQQGGRGQQQGPQQGGRGPQQGPQRGQGPVIKSPGNGPSQGQRGPQRGSQPGSRGQSGGRRN